MKNRHRHHGRSHRQFGPRTVALVGLVAAVVWGSLASPPPRPVPTASAASPIHRPCRMACQGFSPTQGTEGWRYLDRIDGAWRPIRTFSPSGYRAWRQWHDAGGGWVWPTAIRPGPGAGFTTARAWTAPSNGALDITSHAALLDTASTGVVLRITHAGRTIWGPRTLTVADTAGLDATVPGVAVLAGDVIAFEIGNNGDHSHDATT